MQFTEPIFVAFFFFVYFLFILLGRHERGQIRFLLAASYCFYGWWDPRFLALIFASTIVDYYAGAEIFKSQSSTRRKFFLILSLATNLGFLAYFKYANFFLDTIQSLIQNLGFSSNWAPLSIILPIGISFYTFQSMSYTIDIYRRELKPARSLIDFMFFVSAFPQLLAGPIVRAKEFLPQLSGNLAERSRYDGLFWILYGVCKKLFIADLLGYLIVDAQFAAPTQSTAPELWLGIYAYAFQIFLDFSAYSDIALGLGLLFGLKLPVNFRSPYLATHPTEFWTRWHITLSQWLRDYLYIPLGGNRASNLLTLRNLFLVMFLGGLWHGANWTFVIWGILHGLYLVLYRIFDGEDRAFRKLPAWVRGFIFFHLVCIAWVFFRAENVGLALDYLAGLFSFGAFEEIKNITLVSVFLVITALTVHHFVEPHLEKLSQKFTRLHWSIHGATAYLIFLILGWLHRLEINHQAFIYFQF